MITKLMFFEPTRSSLIAICERSFAYPLIGLRAVKVLLTEIGL